MLQSDRNTASSQGTHPTLIRFLLDPTTGETSPTARRTTTNPLRVRVSADGGLVVRSVQDLVFLDAVNVGW